MFALPNKNLTLKIMLQEFKTVVATTVATAATTTGRNCKIHTIVCPKALVGTLTISDGTTTYFTLPIGSIGTFILDAVFPNGVTSTLSSASDTGVLINIATY